MESGMDGGARVTVRIPPDGRTSQLAELVTWSHLENLRDVVSIVEIVGRPELAESLRQWCDQLEAALQAHVTEERPESWWG